MAGNVWKKDVGPIGETGATGDPGTTSVYEVDVTASLTHVVLAANYLTYFDVSSSLATGQTLTLNTTSASRNNVQIVTNNSDYIIEVTDTGSTASYDVGPGLAYTFYKGDDATLKCPQLQGGPVSLTEDRKAFDEKDTDFDSPVTGWVTVAQVDSGGTADMAVGECTVTSELGGTLTCEFGIRQGASAQTFDKATIKTKTPADDSGNYNRVVNFRLAKSDTSNNSGVKLQVYIKAQTSVTVQLRGVTSRIRTLAGIKLVAAVHEDTPLLPDGSTASYLEAGTVLDLTGVGGATIPLPVFARLQSSTTLRLIIPWHKKPKTDASTLSLSYGSMVIDQGGADVYSFSGSEVIGTPTFSEDFVYLPITLSTAHTGVNKACDIRGTNFSATLA